MNVAEADCRYEKINYENCANQHEAHEAKKNGERKRLEHFFHNFINFKILITFASHNRIKKINPNEVLKSTDKESMTTVII